MAHYDTTQLVILLSIYSVVATCFNIPVNFQSLIAIMVSYHAVVSIGRH